MSAAYTKRSPIWLRQCESDGYHRSVRYYRALYQAWPEWAAEDPRFKQIYQRRDQLISMGRKVHVDHIVPLQNALVCGLHVPWNLRIVTCRENLQKSNHWWPDMPYEIVDLFEDLRPHQLTLV